MASDMDAIRARLREYADALWHRRVAVVASRTNEGLSADIRALIEESEQLAEMCERAGGGPARLSLGHPFVAGGDLNTCDYIVDDLHATTCGQPESAHRRKL